MVRRIAIALVSVAMLAACTAPPAVEPSPSSASPSVTVDPLAEDKQALIAQLYGLASAIQWAPDGRPAPIVLTEDAYIIGDTETALDVPGIRLALYGQWDDFCLEGNVGARGEDINAVVYGPSGSFTRETAADATCADVRPEMEPLEIPNANFPGVNGFEQILVTTGTCIDFVFWDSGFGEPLELPIVRDCAGPHEYVIVEADQLAAPDGADDTEIENNADALCGAAANDWSAKTGLDYLYTYYWYPTADAYAEGERAINCFVQVADDIEQSIDSTELFPG